MADVGRRRSAGPGPGGRRDGDRGQLLLVTALSLAVLFVSLALILNTAIYTENLATRSSDIGGGTDAVRYHDATRDGVGGVIEYANYHNNSSQSNLFIALDAGVGDYRAASARQFALGDRAVEASVGTWDYGSRIAQTDESRDFTNKSGSAQWTVAADVDNVRAFRMHVFDTGLLGGLASGFKVVLDDGSGNIWTLTVYEPVTGDLEIEVNGPTAGTCTVSASDAWINVSEGTFGGEPCDVLTTMGDGLTGSYEVRFENAANARGSYTFIVYDHVSAGDTVAESVDAGTNPHLYHPSAGQPFATHAIYFAEIDVVYQTPRLYYESTVRVAPGEPE